ncbi:hypothetical protein BX600DRAFT_515901 [Xylariales sp. PMI_506]|nr:hypothetical protein BX600DRAFT_515901 [Xylariales sp. PMI_506]
MSSSSTSASSSRSGRLPLHERSVSEQNKIGIRLVPYSPPRLDGEAGNSNAADAEAGQAGRSSSSHSSQRALDDPFKSPTRRRHSHAINEIHASDAESVLSSAASSTTSLVRVKGSGVSGSKPGPDLSGVGPSTPLIGHKKRSSSGSNISRFHAPSTPSRRDSGSTSPKKTPRSRRDNIIALHPDKTFSVVLKPVGARVSDASGSTIISPRYSTVSSHEAASSAAGEDRSVSALSSLLDRSASPATPISPSLSDAGDALPDFSPWNYRMVGGVRKVAQTPDFQSPDQTPDQTPNPKQKGKAVETAGLPSSLATVKEVPSSPAEPQTLTTKSSYDTETSEQTDSTIEQTTNYKVIGRSSPPLPESEIDIPPSSSHSNYKVLVESSPVPAFLSSPPPVLFDTPGSKNFIVHGDPSPSSSLPPFRKLRTQESDDTFNLREKYSQESLVIAPLKPVRRQTSHERFGYYKQRSRDTLRRANSFSSISSVISQDLPSSLSDTPNLVRLNTTPSISSLRNSPWAGPSNIPSNRARMEGHPHQWSSQLSTVMSEDERSNLSSRHLSVASSQEHRSLSHDSRHSRQMLSISSSMLALEELSAQSSHSRSNSRSDNGGHYMRGARELPTPPTRMVRDIDEDGDGLADLHQLHHKGSRQRFLAHKSSERSLASVASSRSGSISVASIPVWARIYYGSGERKWLAAPSIRSYSDESRPTSGWAPSGSPEDDFVHDLRSPRKRPRELRPEADRPISTEYPTVKRTVRRMTSSLWSPHLQHDRRPSPLHIWQAPSMTWSSDQGNLGRRNAQVAMFVVGFIFPLAWIIAAFLPLPPKPTMEMVERDNSATELGLPDDEETVRRTNPHQDAVYRNARWWRNLNRVMAIVGLLIIGAVVALAIVGFWQNMKH